MCQVGSALRGQREHMVHLNDIWFLRKLLGPAVSSDRPLLAALRREKSVVRVHEGNCFLRLLRLFVRKDSLPLSASLSLHLSTGQLPSQQQLSLTHCSTEWLSLPNPASPLGPGDPLFPLLFGPLLLKFKRTLKEMAFPLPTLFTLCSSAHVTYLFLFYFSSSVSATSSRSSKQVRSSCGFPGSPKDGRVLHLLEKYEEGMVVTFECDPGYYLLGSMTRSCLSNGTWSGSMPVCGKHYFYLQSRARF